MEHKFKIDSNPQLYKGAFEDFDSNLLDYVQKRQGTDIVKYGKCIMVGDTSVGKTCIIKRFSQNEFMENHRLTIGVDFEIFDFSILGQHFKLNMWDTAGEERFKSITKTYYRDAHSAIIVFDFSKIVTLSSIKRWSEEVRTYALNKNPYTGEQDEPLLFVVGTKKDLVTQDAFEFIESQAMRIASEIKAFYWSVSSSTGENIENLFRKLAVQTFTEILLRESETIEILTKRTKSETLKIYDKKKTYANNFLRSSIPPIKLKDTSSSKKFSWKEINKRLSKSRCFR